MKREKKELIIIKEPLLFNIKSVAERLNVTIKQIRDLIFKGELQAVHDSPCVNDSPPQKKGYYIRGDSLKAYCRRNNLNLFQPDFRFTGRVLIYTPPRCRLKRYIKVYTVLEETRDKIMVRPESVPLRLAAEMLGISSKQIYRLVNEKKIEPIKSGKDDCFIPYAQLHSYVEKYTLPEKVCRNL